MSQLRADPADPVWPVAEKVAEAARRRHPAGIIAVGAQGALAHGTPAAAVELLALTYRPGTGPRPGTRRVDGTLITLTVVAAEERLRVARVLDEGWPLGADRFVSTVPLHDPEGWFGRVRDAHLARLVEARNPEFTALARQRWYRAALAHAEAIRLAGWYETEAALLLLGQARLAAATVAGLMERTYFRGPADAVRRTGLAGADMGEVGTILGEQAEELARRGHPVDGTVSDLVAP